MRRATAPALVLAVLLAALVSASSPAVALPDGTRVATYKSGLDFPVDMAWVKGTKKIFFTEKNTGKVRVLIGRRLLGRACVNLDVASAGEQGALGITLHPRFKKTKWLYVMYTNASPEEMRVTRFTVRQNRCRRPRPILANVPASSGYHNGGQLEFVGNKLFIATGENHDAAAAQSTTNRLGKILRYNADGSVPSDNPFSLPANPNPVWSYGHRNPFGLARRPGTTKLYESENGPSCDDELNLIRKGRNYGWGGGYTCGSGTGMNPVAPLKRWTPPIVPTDLWWYKGRMGSLSGSLYMGDFDGDLHRFVMNDRGTRVRQDRIIYSGDSIVDVSKGPGGWLYFMTTDAILRIVPN
ncbi:MAG TPA: PQQ-dependent sugar dehydrogenase [Actinomycetota bacterium]|nr:PQQ-dependent sugar dehydrogenase [Actinomycetota bacterium]